MIADKLTNDGVPVPDAVRRAVRRRRARLAAVAAPVAVLAMVLSACSSGSPAPTQTVTKTAAPAGDTSTTPTRAPSTSSPAPQPVTFQATPKARHNVDPTTPVTLAVDHGTLRTVRMLSSDGRWVTGKISADGTEWHTTEVLGYGKSYRLTAKALGESGETKRTFHRVFTTLTPGNMTLPYIDDLYGASIQNHGTYGVAMVVNVVFDEHIPDEAAAEKALHVTTTPHVDGSWYWVDDMHAHWRPHHYYPAGTKVTVNADVYGVEVGPGLYGQSDVSRSFTIGRKQVTVTRDVAVDPDHPHGKPHVNKVRVYNGAGKVLRTMNTSMGKHGGETVNGKYINFYTLNGTYTVLGFENPAHMCSDSYGLPPDAPGGYDCEDVPWSTKISTDGIYLHELDNTIYDQDHGYDVSHGCLNLDHANAKWFFKHSLVGDPVVVHGAKGAPTLQVWQGGDWTLPWSQWLAGSALH